MPTPTEKNTERIEKLGEVVNELIRRIDKAEGDADWAREWVEKLRAADAELRLMLHTSNHEIAELKRSGRKTRSPARSGADGGGALCKY